MLGIFRRSQRVVLWIVLVVVVLSFVFWGVRGGGILQNVRHRTIVGTIGTDNVTGEQLARAIRGAKIELQLNGVDKELLNQPKELEMEGWRRLVQLDAARKAGVVVSPQELMQFVHNYLFRGNEFDDLQYRQLIMQLAGRISPREFEEDLADTLTILKARQALVNTQLVTDDEIRQSYDVDHTLLRLGYVPFYYTSFLAGVTISTNELEDFYNTNTNDFRVPPQVDLVLAVARVQPEKVDIADDDVRYYYEENHEQYLITNTPAAESLEPQYEPFEKVEPAIRATLAEEEAHNVALDAAERLSFAMEATNITALSDKLSAFRTAATSLGLTVVTSGLVSLDGALSGLNSTDSYAIIRTALGQQVGTVSDVTELPGMGQALFIVAEQREEYVPPLAEIEPQVRREISRRRALDAARSAAEQLRHSVAAVPMPFTNAVAALGYTVQTTELLDREKGVPALGLPSQLIARLFAFPVNTPVVIPFLEGYLLASSVTLIEADPELVYGDYDERKTRLLRQGDSLIYNAYFSQAARNVKINESVLREPAEELE